VAATAVSIHAPSSLEVVALLKSAAVVMGMIIGVR
jgi:hypothetical protein